MRLDRKQIHPSLLAAYRTYRTGHHAHERQRWAQIFGCTLGAGMGALSLRLGASFLVSLATVILVIALSWFGFSGSTARESDEVSVAEFSEAFDELIVEDTWRAYVDTLVALEASGSGTQAPDTLQALNALLDEESNLHRARVKLADIQRSGDVEALNDERRAIVRDLESVKDALAREALLQSLSVVDERLSGQRRYEEYAERLAAHLILIRQTIFATRDAAQRLQALPLEAATDSLRSIVSQARAQSRATERALAELNAT